MNHSHSAPHSVNVQSLSTYGWYLLPEHKQYIWVSGIRTYTDSNTASISTCKWTSVSSPPQKSLLLSSFSLASTRSIFVSINKARDEIRCHCYNKRICDNGKNSNAFQDPVPDACSTRRVCLLQKKQEPKCLKYCMIWSSCPHFTRCFYVVFIQESLSENKFSYWTGRF